jgi:hypothetical protein
MQQTCSHCGALNAPETTTCASCGAALGDPEPTPAISSSEEAAGQPQPTPLPPSRKRSPLRLALLATLALLLVAGLGAGGFWFYAAHQQPKTHAPPPLYANNLTKSAQEWQCQHGAYCLFANNGLHILAPTDHLYFSFLAGKQFSEQEIDVKVKLDNGDPQFVGFVIAFRSVGIAGYGWVVYANGTYQLVKWDTAGMAVNLIPLTRSSAIHTGLEQFNHLKIVAKGSAITLFINDQRLQQVNDATYSSGGIGLGAARYAADAVFSNLTITKP